MQNAKTNFLGFQDSRQGISTLSTRIAYFDMDNELPKKKHSRLCLHFITNFIDLVQMVLKPLEWLVFASEFNELETLCT